MNYDKKFIVNSIKTLGLRHGIHESFGDVVTCCAYSFANSVDFKESRENEYLRIINKYSEEERNLFPKILAALVNEYEKADEPIDILGDIYEELELIKKNHSQFFTPIHLCDLLAKISIDKDKCNDDLKNKGFVNVSDPNLW